MHTIAFDLIVSELKKHYKDPYHNAYAEVRKVLKQNNFYWIQGSTYATQGDLRTLFRAIQSLKKYQMVLLFSKRYSRFQNRRLLRFHSRISTKYQLTRVKM